MRRNRRQTNDAIEIIDRHYGANAEWDTLVAEETLKANVGQLVHDLRTEAGLSQTKLADLIGTSQSVISRVENADYEGSAIEILARVCFALHKSISVSRKKGGPIAVAC